MKIKCPHCDGEEGFNIQETVLKDIDDNLKLVKVYAVCCGGCDTVLTFLPTPESK